jgi:hypothetical protein
MTMHARSALPALILVAAAATAVRADTLRCGSRLVEPGESAAAVLAQCGEPSTKEVITEPVRARTPAGGTRVIGTTQKEIWRYERGSGSFPAILTFEEGVLKKLEFEKG